MFTGIVEEMGTVETLTEEEIIIESVKISGMLEIGGSIAINGVCLTVKALNSHSVFTCDTVPETLRRTNLGALRRGDKVNLESPLTIGKPMGGHFLQGHIDATGRIISEKMEGNSVILFIEAPHNLMRYIVEKGFIGIDGVSLTVVNAHRDSFTIALIPSTVKATTLGAKHPPDTVNLEADIIAKYLEKFASPYTERI